MSRNLPGLLVAFILALGIAAPSQANPQAAYNDAMEQMGLKRYRAACQSFQQAIEEAPSNQNYHYQLAVCLQTLQEYGIAEDEYTSAYRLNPFNALGKTARAAVVDVEALIQRRDHPTDTIPVYAQAVREINRQSDDVQNRWIDWGNRQADYRTRLGQIEVDKLSRENNMYLRNGRNMQRGDSMMMSQAQSQANYMYYDTMVQANRYRQDGTHAAAETQISANTLKQLLAEPPTPGNPHLRALGTNLYIRNYNRFDEEPPAPDPPLELRARAKLLNGVPGN